MTRTIKFPLAYALAILACACWMLSCTPSGHEVEVSYKNFGEEVTERQHLRFTFTHDLAPRELLDQWSDTPYARLEPAVAGKFKWVLPNELQFSPDSGFAPATTYQLAFQPELLNHLAPKQALGLGPNMAFQFRTPALQLLDAKPFWSVDAQHQPELRMALQFNYPVSVETLLPRLALAVGEKAIAYTLLTTQASQQVELAVQADTLQASERLSVRIAAGLALARAQTADAGQMGFETEVPTRESFRILHAQAAYNGPQAIIDITANQAVGSDNLASFVSVSPEIPMRIVPKSNGFVLEGHFQHGVRYQLLIDRRLKGAFQTPMAADFQQDILFAKPSPALAFAERGGMVLSTKGKRRVGLRIAGVPQVQVEIYKIYENNVIHFLENNYLSYSYYDQEYFSGMERYGDLVLQTRLSTDEMPDAGGLKLLSLNFRNNNDLHGLYVVQVSSAEDRWVRASKVVAFSDIGLVVKKTDDDLWVFANSLMTAEPVTGANITLVGQNNQALHTMPTNAKGFVRFTGLRDAQAGFAPALVTANRGGDFAFIHLQQSEQASYEDDVDGYQGNEAGLQAFLHSERNLYRPGETLRLHIMVRDEAWQVPAPLPLKLLVRTPMGEALPPIRCTPNANGSAEASVAFDKTLPTGTYYLELQTPHEVSIGHYEVSVEEFMPDRIKVQARLDTAVLELGKPALLRAQAVNLFGPPASYRPYDVSVYYSTEEFKPKGLDDYSFAMKVPESYIPGQFSQGQTDAEGQLLDTLLLPAAYAFHGWVSGTAYVSVADENGRSVSKRVNFAVPTQPAFYGISRTEYYLDGDRPIRIPLVAASPAGAVFRSKKARLEVIRYEWQHVLEQDYRGRMEYRSKKIPVKLDDREVTIQGRQYAYLLEPDQSGEYEIRVSEPGTESYARRSFYVYKSGGTSIASFDIDRSGDIEIAGAKSSYKVGEEAQLLFKMPFSGQLLVTVERDRVLRQYAFTATSGTAEAFAIPITEDMAPNAYVSATLIKPISDDNVPLTVAHGYLSLSVEKPDSRLPLRIEVPEKMRSNTRQTVAVQLEKPQAGVEVTIAVVDEGILQIKGTPSPDPHAFFYQKRALGVHSYDLYARLLPEYRMARNRYGADADLLDEALLGKRLNPLSNDRVEPASFWSGTLVTDAKGRAAFSFTAPAGFSGKLRVAVTAAKGQAFGKGTAYATVADPLVVSAGLPRFASPGDRLQVPVMLANTTDAPLQAEVAMAVSGTIGQAKPQRLSVSIPPHQERSVFFEAQAQMALGQGTVTITAKAGGETFEQSTELGVRPASTLVRTHRTGTIKGGAQVELGGDARFLPGIGEAKLVVGRAPVLGLAPHLRYLLEYPHGCLEQTISAAFPQLYLAELSRLLQQDVAQEQIDRQVQGALKQVFSQQHYSGGLSYWPGGDAHPWASAYAAHFTAEAIKAGYSSPGSRYTDLLAYLTSHVRGRPLEVAEVPSNQPGTVRRQPRLAKEVPYMLYVLALAGKPEPSTMNYCRSNLAQLDESGKWLLAAAYWLAGDMKTGDLLAPGVPRLEEKTAGLAGYSDFRSPLRDYALVMLALQQARPQHKALPGMAQALDRQLAESPYLSTQERAFGVLALGKFAKAVGAEPVQVRVLADGKQIAQYEQGTLSIGQQLAGKRLTLQATGPGTAYYYWEASGLPQAGQAPQADSQLEVRREFFDRMGRPLDPAVLKQYDVVVVRLSLRAQGLPVANVAVSDLLPAGWEVENPRIREVPGMDWAANAADPEHLDFRDDRVNLYASASSDAKYFYYVARAVSKGTFQMGPVSAEAMYHGAHYSYHGARTVKVE